MDSYSSKPGSAGETKIPKLRNAEEKVAEAETLTTRMRGALMPVGPTQPAIVRKDLKRTGSRKGKPAMAACDPWRSAQRTPCGKPRGAGKKAQADPVSPC